MPDKALIVVDVQNDFMPNGSLGVPQGDTIIDPINALITRYNHVILTQDWHPPRHSSFASTHKVHAPYDVVPFIYGPQTLWPDHCIQGSFGADFAKGLITSKAELILRKGYNRHIDSYSAFFENDHKTPTGLSSYLKERGIKEILLCGLATDFCVGYSALDAIKNGFGVSVALDACAGLDLNGSLNHMLKSMNEAGVKLFMIS
ncbi:bifunctional nicotinamidase/pyrazinamidase [Bartonella sp. DGB2]|uniref:bifunctional nicotinamidase/pyrazinamidase n=1 Tax=Bartonella sp. DGB2 TaxID=3388426 RepID=UPI0039901534